MTVEQLLRPSSIAVVGASPRTFVGSVVLENSRRLGFEGSIFPVGRHEEVAGFKGYPSLTELPTTVDVAVIQVRADRVLDVVNEGLAKGIRGFVIPGAGFTDSGEAALRLASDLQELHKHTPYELIGPNCMGALDLITRAAPYIGTVTDRVRQGSVGLVAQSGAVVEAIVNCGGRVPLSTAVSAGSESITDVAKYLQFFAKDPHTSAVLAFIETLSDPQGLMDAIHELSEVGKPVAVCIVGHSQTATEGITAHSGRLAVGARLATTAVAQAGGIVARDLDELLALGELFGTKRGFPSGKKLHAVTNSGGEGNLLADVADEVGLELPKMTDHISQALAQKWPTLNVRNPLDPWGTDDYEVIYPEAIRRITDEAGDIVMVSMDQHSASGEHERELGRNLARYLADAVEGTAKFPVLLSPVSDDADTELVAICRQLQIPLLRGARTGMSAIAKLVNWQNAARMPRRVNDPWRDTIVPRLSAEHARDEHQVLEALSTIGVRTPRRLLTADPETAAAVAASFESPVVLKGIASSITHKTELGLVAVNPNDVAAAAREMQRRNPELSLNFLVAELIRGDIEIIVGFKRDAHFGPTLIVGIGGVWAEFHAEVSLHIGFVDEASASALLDSSTAGRMIARARGGVLDHIGVVRTIVAISDIARLNPEIQSLEVNPLIVGRDHSTAVDAVIEFQ